MKSLIINNAICRKRQDFVPLGDNLELERIDGQRCNYEATSIVLHQGTVFPT